MPERREREWSEASGEESEDNTELEARSRPEEDRLYLVFVRVTTS